MSASAGLRARNPATGETLDGEFREASPGDIDAAARAAERAFDPYAALAPSRRAEFLRAVAQKILGLDVLTSRQLPPGNAIVMQRKRAGFVADELPFQASPLYRQEERKSSRSDVQRASAIGLDEPLSIVLLSGV